MGVSQFYIVYCWVHYDLFSPKIWYFLLFFSCSPSSQHQLVFVYCINVYLFHYHPNQSMWAELSGENFRSPLTWVFAPPAQSRTRSLRSIPLPAHLQFHPAPVKSPHARSNLKLLCMPKTCRFQPKPGTHCLRGRRGAGLLRDCCGKKSASLLFCRGAAVAVWLDRAPDTRVFRRQCGCSNLLT